MPKLIEARGQLIRLHAELLQLESHIRTMRESVQSAITQSSKSSHHTSLVPNENARVERIAENVAFRLEASSPA